MKHWLSIAFVLLVLNSSGQEGSPIIATSGSGIGNITLGMSEQEVRKIMDGKFSEVGFMQKMQEFKHFNKDIRVDSLLEFVLGFDKELSASDELLKNTPVFNLCFKDNRLNYIGIISYPPSDSVAKELLLDGQARFFISEEEGKKILGNDYLKVRYMDYTDLIYYKRGLEVLYDAGKLTCIVIFEPTPDYLDKMRNKQSELLKQFKDIPEE
jgi:hypothetical protein